MAGFDVASFAPNFTTSARQKLKSNGSKIRLSAFFPAVREIQAESRLSSNSHPFYTEFMKRKHNFRKFEQTLKISQTEETNSKFP